MVWKNLLFDLYYHKQLRSMLMVPRIITWGLRQEWWKDLKSTYCNNIDRTIEFMQCGVIPGANTSTLYNTTIGIRNI